jgi:hypothetical protein
MRLHARQVAFRESVGAAAEKAATFQRDAADGVGKPVFAKVRARVC